MNYAYLRHLLRDMVVVSGSIVLSIILVKGNVIQNLIHSTDSFILPSLVAGAFFTSIFTVAPATVGLLALSKLSSPILVAAVAALGGMIIDLSIASFVRKDISQDLNGLTKMSFRRHVLKAFHFGFLKWIAFVFGLFLIVTPFPDELGLMLIGLSQVRSWVLPIVFYIAHFAGIFALLSIIERI